MGGHALILTSAFSICQEQVTGYKKKKRKRKKKDNFFFFLRARLSGEKKRKKEEEKKKKRKRRRSKGLTLRERRLRILFVLLFASPPTPHPHCSFCPVCFIIYFEVSATLVFDSGHEFICLRQSFVQCCSTSEKAVRIIRDGKPRSSTSFTQFLSSECCC